MFLVMALLYHKARTLAGLAASRENLWIELFLAKAESSPDVFFEAINF
jgi:hypothetical protein